MYLLFSKKTSNNLLKIDSMDFRTLELNISQLSKCISKSKFNKYSDSRKAEYQVSLVKLFSLLQSEDFSILNPTQLVDKKKIVDFIFESIQYLDNSTLTIIPYEIVYCLESALDECIPNNKFIVVTSLSNQITSYSINGNLALNKPIYQLIDSQYNINFEYKLIQITLPRYYVHDYLANAVLYHELGHFVDLYFAISQSIVNTLVLTGKIPNDFNNPLYYRSLRHNMEYFADIFAAQYIGKASNYFLDYIAHKAPDSNTHPATDLRLEKVDKFLNNDTSDLEIEDIKKYTLARSGFNLEIKHVELSIDDFFSLIPYEITNQTELHSIFLTGWNAWLENPNKLKTDFDNDTAYKIINNLIEKSISNFIVVDSWNK